MKSLRRRWLMIGSSPIILLLFIWSVMALDGGSSEPCVWHETFEADCTGWTAGGAYSWDDGVQRGPYFIEAEVILTTGAFFGEPGAVVVETSSDTLVLPQTTGCTPYPENLGGQWLTPLNGNYYADIFQTWRNSDGSIFTTHQLQFGPFTCEVTDCGCESQVTQLTLQYNGSEAALIRVEGKKGKKSPVLFEDPDPVASGGQFSFTGENSKNMMGPKINIYVWLVDHWEWNAIIHTSCSQPIGRGLVSGDFTVIDGYSTLDIPLCDL